MFGLNWIDAVIVVLLVLAIVEGVRIGLLSQLFVIAGFFAALFAAGWLFPHLVRFHDPVLRTTVNAALVLVAAAYAAMRSFDLAQRIHWSFRVGSHMDSRKLKFVETILGALPGLAAGVVLVWLLGVMLGRLPFVGLSNSVTDARIVQELTRALPPAPAVFAAFNQHIDPNAQPYVAVRPRPQASFDYAPADVQRAQAKAASSVVRITSFSCGGIVSGTGFAVGPSLIATNAHVIAGSRRPVVKYGGISYESTLVYFDANLDLAMLRVPDLAAPPLALAPANLPLNTTVAVLGYPGGNYRVEPGIIRDTLAVAGASIYDQGTFGRGIYVLQAQVDYGNSGSPIVTSAGQVAGIIYSASTESPNTAYGLTSPHIATALRRAVSSHARVGTGACMVQ
jgi:S1-C subfamily serine protease